MPAVATRPSAPAVEDGLDLPEGRYRGEILDAGIWRTINGKPFMQVNVRLLSRLVEDDMGGENYEPLETPVDRPHVRWLTKPEAIEKAAEDLQALGYAGPLTALKDHDWSRQEVAVSLKYNEYKGQTTPQLWFQTGALSNQTLDELFAKALASPRKKKEKAVEGFDFNPNEL